MSGAESIGIGNCRCWTLADGELLYPGSLVLPPEGQPPGEMWVPYAGMLVETGSVRILIDTGAGALGPKTGKLPESLRAAGFSPDDIDMVIFSHGHPDHIGGLGQFPNAGVVMMRKEFEFWTAAETQAKLEAGAMYGLGPFEQMMAAAIRDLLEPARDRLRLLDGPAEIAGGVLVFPAPGHTPGHAAVLISSERQQLLYVGDAIIHPAQFEHPDWLCAFDLAGEDTIGTRKELLDRASTDQCLLAASHLPGVAGAVEGRQSRYRWEPAAAEAF